MQILIISGKDSRPQIAITAFLVSTGAVETSISPAILPLFDLDDADCTIYIATRPDPEIVDRLRRSECSTILVSNQDFIDSDSLFIPFGILDRSDSVSIGIKKIRDHLGSIPFNPNATLFSTDEYFERVDSGQDSKAERFSSFNSSQHVWPTHQFLRAS